MKTKALYYACLAFLLVVNHVTIAQNNVWTTSYPYGGYVQSACFVIDPNNPSILYVAPTLGGIYKSTDDGLTWNSMTDNVELLFSPLTVQFLKLDANSNLFVIASGSQSGNIFKNHNGNWSVISGNINSQVYCIEIDKNNSKNIYAGTANGLYRTDNGGDTWSSINNGLPADVYKYIAIDPQHSEVIYVGFSNNGIYKSTNNGLSWTLITSDPVMKNIESIIVNPNNSQVVFSVINIDYENNKLVYKTSDGGNSWIKVLELNLPDHLDSFWHYSAITFNPLNPQILFAASFGKVFKSIDGGNNWTANDVSDIEVNSVIVNPTNVQIMYVGTHGNGVYKSNDGGTTWINRSVGMRAVYSISPRSLDIDSNNGYIYSGSVAYFYLSVDKGRTWVKKKFPNNGVTTLLTNPIEPGFVYGWHNDIYKSADFGDTWQDISSGFMGNFTDGNIALDPTNPSIIYVAGSNSKYSLPGIYKTTNGGQTWQLLNNGLTNTTVHSIAVHPFNGNIVYTGTRSCSPCNSKSGLFRTLNGGLDWQRITTGLPADFEVNDIFIHPSDPSFVFISTNFGSYKSIDAGENWIKISDEGNTIKSNPDDPKMVYIAGSPSGFQISNDGGTTWLRKNDGIPLQTAFESLKVDPKNKNHVYISTSRGVYEMTITDEMFFVLSVSPNTLSIEAPNNSSTSFDITSNISWTTTSDPKWLTVSSPTGSNNATITLTAQANPTIVARTTIVTVSGTGVTSQTITVTQTGAAPVLTVSPFTLALAGSGGSTATIAVSSNINWTTASNQSWLTVSSPTGTNNSTITLTAVANPTTNARTATVTVSGTGVPPQIIAVSQTGAAPVLTVSPNTLSIEAPNNSTKAIDITSNISWTTTSDQKWLTVSSQTGSNNATITLTAQANPTIVARKAFVTVSGAGVTSQSIEVTQTGAAPVLTVSPISLTIAASGGSTATIAVSSNINWTPTSNQSWLTLNSPTGSNNSTITLTAIANPTTNERTATVTVSGTGVPSQIIAISQTGAAPVLTVSPITLTISASASNTKTIDISSNISWTTTSDQKWLTVSSPIGSNNATITLTAQANPTTFARTTIVTVSGTGVTSQAIAVTQTGAAPVLTVLPNTIALSASGGSTATIAVSSNMNWTTTSNQSWLTVSSPTGTNNSTITLTAVVNPTTNARTATVTVSGTGVPPPIIAVSQTGAAPVLTVSPNTLSIEAPNNSTKAIDITSNISWTTSSDQKWLTVSSPAGSNNATLTITAQANPITIPRTAKIAVSGTGVADVILNVKQDAADVENSEIFIFPNPTNTMMYVNGINQNSTVSIFDMSGKMLISGQIKDNQLNISNLAIGVYLVKIVDKKGIVTSKLLKQ